MNKELIDEFEKEFPPKPYMTFVDELGIYVANRISNTVESVEITKQNARLEVWLKQREKIEKLQSKLHELSFLFDAMDFCKRNEQIIDGIWETLKETGFKELEAADD